MAIEPIGGGRALSAGSDGTIRLWDLAKRCELDRLDLGPYDAPRVLSRVRGNDGASTDVVFVGTFRGLRRATSRPLLWKGCVRCSSKSGGRNC